MTPHIESKKEDIAPIVLMPGDPLRAKFIAETYLKDYKLVNTVRNVFAYTGYYKDKRVTVFASGMGIPSIGIYAYELYKFYDVEKIIRIGSCGSNDPKVNILDVILVSESYSESTFAHLFNGEESHVIKASKQLTNHIEKVAKEKGTKLHIGTIMTSDGFDYYIDIESALKRIPKELKVLGAEMESFGLFHLANSLGKEAACLLTVVDSRFDERVISSEDRQKSLTDMIELALDSIVTY